MARTGEKGPVLWRYEVRHPEYGTVIVVSIGPDSATMAAAEVWGVPELWGKLAGYCDVKRLGPAARPRCQRCAQEFGKAGDAAGLCPWCQQAAELHRREMAGVRGGDRRARWGRG